MRPDIARNVLLFFQLVRLRRLRKRKQQISKKKRLWMHPMLLACKNEGEYSRLMPRLRMDEKKFFAYLRMPIQQFDLLLDRIRMRLEMKSHRAIESEEQLVIALRFFATGMQYRALEFAFRRANNTISQIVKRVSAAIWELRSEYLAVPTNDEWRQIANGFEQRWQMPCCIGALDGKLVLVKKPGKSGSLFHDYKHNFSINLLALCDDRYRLSFVDLGDYGYKGDANVFATSALKQKLDNGNLGIPGPKILPGLDDQSPLVHHFIVADAAFPLSLAIMKPFSGADLSHEQRIYNYRISRARRIIENVFGIICAKWRLLLKPIETSVENANWIVRAILVLHNFLIDECKGKYRPELLADRANDKNLDGQNGIWRRILGGKVPLQQGQQIPNRAANWPKDAKTMRQHLLEYFNSEIGSVPWQERMI